MLKTTILGVALALALPFAAAQAPSPASSPAKKELVARILKMQQPGIEGMGRNLAEQPALELLRNASNALPARVAKDKQEAVANEIQADVKKYLDDAAPLVQSRAVKLAPTTIGALLEEKFTEDELKQVLAIIESPVYGKFQRMGEEMQKVLIEKLVADMRVDHRTQGARARTVRRQAPGRHVGARGLTRGQRATAVGKAGSKAGIPVGGFQRACRRNRRTLSGSGPTDSTAWRSSGSLQCNHRVQLRRSHSCSRLTSSSLLPCLPLSSDIQISLSVLPA